MAASDHTHTAPTRVDPTIFHLDAETDRALRTCIHCGLCLNSCPTYKELGAEMDSPRGRLYLMRAMNEGRLELTDGLNASAVHHLDLCLGCRACEPACPSGVQYGRILEDARVEIARVRTVHRGRAHGRFETFLMRHLLTRRNMLNLSIGGLRLYNALGLERLLHKLGPQALIALEAKKPALQGPSFQANADHIYPAHGQQRGRVCFFTGCIMDAVMGDIHRDTIAVLQHQGVEVVIPRGQVCCGALHIHAGDEEYAKSLARRTLDSLREENFDAFVNNSAGCGAHIRTWGHLLRHDDTYREYAESIAAKTIDVTRYLVNLGEQRPYPHPVRRTVGYDAPCHLVHAQREGESPLLLLRALPGLTVKELENCNDCCGAAGLYTITQPDMADRLFAKKLRAIRRAGIHAVTTGNPGCIMQFQQGLAKAGLASIATLHPMQVLAMGLHGTAVDEPLPARPISNSDTQTSLQTPVARRVGFAEGAAEALAAVVEPLVRPPTVLPLSPPPPKPRSSSSLVPTSPFARPQFDDAPPAPSPIDPDTAPLDRSPTPIPIPTVVTKQPAGVPIAAPARPARPAGSPGGAAPSLDPASIAAALSLHATPPATPVPDDGSADATQDIDRTNLRAAIARPPAPTTASDSANAPAPKSGQAATKPGFDAEATAMMNRLPSAVLPAGTVRATPPKPPATPAAPAATVVSPTPPAPEPAAETGEEAWDAAATRELNRADIRPKAPAPPRPSADDDPESTHEIDPRKNPPRR